MARPRVAPPPSCAARHRLRHRRFLQDLLREQDLIRLGIPQLERRRPVVVTQPFTVHRIAAAITDRERDPRVVRHLRVVVGLHPRFPEAFPNRPATLASRQFTRFICVLL